MSEAPCLAVTCEQLLITIIVLCKVTCTFSENDSLRCRCVKWWHWWMKLFWWQLTAHWAGSSLAAVVSRQLQKITASYRCGHLMWDNQCDLRDMRDQVKSYISIYDCCFFFKYDWLQCAGWNFRVSSTKAMVEHLSRSTSRQCWNMLELLTENTLSAWLSVYLSLSVCLVVTLVVLVWCFSILFLVSLHVFRASWATATAARLIVSLTL